MARFRVPAGVYVGGVPLGGRFADVAQLVSYARRADVDGALRIGELLERAARRAGRSRRVELQRAVTQIVRMVERKGPRERPPTRREELPELPEAPPEDVDIEWEWGMAYVSSGHRTSNLDINIRVAREDGAQMPRSEARRVFHEFLNALVMRNDVELPHGYRFAAVNWRRPTQHGEWRGGYHRGSHELEEMIGPMIEYADDPRAWRFERVDDSDTGI